MFATFTAADLTRDDALAGLTGVGLVRIGGPDDLTFDDIPGEILGIGYTDTHETHVKIQVAFYLTEDPAGDYPVTTHVIVRPDTTIGIEYNDPNPPKRMRKPARGATQHPTVHPHN